MIRLASEKQVSFLKSLLETRDYSGEQPVFETLSSGEASDLITKLLKTPTKPKGGGVGVSKVGMYQTADGTIYRVHESRMSGNLYAKKLDALAGTFEYESGAIYRLTADDKMSLENARAWGLETGMCCVCGTMLTDEVSVANGIGPVCEKKKSFW
jgi:hypothetical protein